MPEPQARLRIGSYGERSVTQVMLYLRAVEDAHDGLLAFLNLLDRELEIPRSGRRLTPQQVATRLLKETRPTRVVVNQLLEPNRSLVVSRVSIASPGFWEFLGALNPLNAINTYLEGRHERGKDRRYRETAERDRLDLENERLHLENQLLETRVVQERLALAEQVGVSQHDRDVLFRRLVVDSATPLIEEAAQGMVFPASALPELQAPRAMTAGPDGHGRITAASSTPPDELPPLINPPNETN